MANFIVRTFKGRSSSWRVSPFSNSISGSTIVNYKNLATIAAERMVKSEAWYLIPHRPIRHLRTPASTPLALTEGAWAGRRTQQ